MRKSIEMTEDESYQHLENRLTAVLGTVGLGGYPHQANMMYIVRPGTIELTAFTKSQKVRNLVRHPRASLLAEVTMPYSAVKGAMFQGDVTLVEDLDEIVRVAHGVAERFARLDPESWAPNPEVDIEATARKRTLIRLDVTRIVSWDHSKLAGGY